MTSAINKFHELNWQRMQVGTFGPPHDKVTLVACIAEEVGELAAAVLRVERIKVRTTSTKAEVLDGIADAIAYLSLLASAYGCTDLEALVIDTFDAVSDRAGIDIKVRRATKTPIAHPLMRAAEDAQAICPKHWCLRSRCEGEPHG